MNFCVSPGRNQFLLVRLKRNDNPQKDKDSEGILIVRISTSDQQSNNH